MPKLDALPHLTIIQGLKGILDFYYWKGIPCVRKWPVIPPSSRSPRSLESARIFGAILAAYSLLGAILKELFAENAADQPRTARDLFVSAVLGHLHDHNMSDFLDLLTEATAYLAVIKDLTNALNAIGTDELRVKPGYDGADYFPLLIDAQRHLQADILASALPSGAATDAHQATMITALQLIDDLRAALETVHDDRLLVRGMDQLHSYKQPLRNNLSTTVSGANGIVDSNTPPEGLAWRITHIASRDITSATTRQVFQQGNAGILSTAHNELRAIGANEWVTIPVNIWLEHDDFLRVTYIGSLPGDTCLLQLTGQVFTKET